MPGGRSRRRRSGLAANENSIADEISSSSTSSSSGRQAERKRARLNADHTASAPQETLSQDTGNSEAHTRLTSTIQRLNDPVNVDSVVSNPDSVASLPQQPTIQNRERVPRDSENQRTLLAAQHGTQGHPSSYLGNLQHSNMPFLLNPTQSGLQALGASSVLQHTSTTTTLGNIFQQRSYLATQPFPASALLPLYQHGGINSSAVAAPTGLSLSQPSRNNDLLLSRAAVASGSHQQQLQQLLSGGVRNADDVLRLQAYSLPLSGALQQGASLRLLGGEQQLLQSNYGAAIGGYGLLPTNHNQLLFPVAAQPQPGAAFLGLGASQPPLQQQNLRVISQNAASAAAAATNQPSSTATSAASAVDASQAGLITSRTDQMSIVTDAIDSETFSNRTEDGVPHDLPTRLALPGDHHKLSIHQTYLRLQIEVFRGSSDDASMFRKGRNKPVQVGQVGIRCLHCADVAVRHKQKGSVYFPATINGIYQAAQNMSTTHLQCGLCSEMPAEVKQNFVSLLSTKSGSSGAGRPYWEKAAQTLGLVDTEDGIRFFKDLSSSSNSDDSSSDSDEASESNDATDS